MSCWWAVMKLLVEVSPVACSQARSNGSVNAYRDSESRTKGNMCLVVWYLDQGMHSRLVALQKALIRHGASSVGK